ncbi:glycosyltransferase family 39 protein [Catellatospora sp. TT07R-123]|uniref:ArnT family glycosyltransferase n=1 Tax=Catellatospora sp. TT07R-123 TaxID=2733863 RepID=UPI001BB3D27B|nr:glycosyltransferase family 39 protein [Catellatospora sp. TT07R-123]
MQLHLYYGPGVRSMSRSWTAWWSGAWDPAATTTFDKLPGTFWLQALSARVFGFTPWAVLLPSLIASVAAIAMLYVLVSRWLGPGTGVLAAVFFATTPLVAALARTQIPDPVLIALLLGAALTWQQATRTARTSPLLWTAVIVGAAFQVKMAQAWLVWVPFALAYLVYAPTSLARRAWQLALAGLVTVAVSLSWMVGFTLVPAASRPYVDGSVDNSIWSMVFGYNGFNRYGVDNTGAQMFGIGGPPGKAEGPAWLYLLRDGVAPQIGWLYLFALAGVAAAAVQLVRRRDSAPATAAMYLMWPVWTAVHAVAFAGSVKAHSFYNLALVPAVAALAAAGAHQLRAAYHRPGWQRWLLPSVVAASAWWAWELSGRFAFAPWLPAAALGSGLGAAAVLAAVNLVRAGGPTRAVAFGLAVVALAVAPATWALSVTGKTSVSDAHRPAGGPASREVASVLSGRMLRLLPAAQVEAITAFLDAHRGGEQFQVAVPWAPQAGQFLLRDVAVLPVGGFTAQAPTVTPQRLDELVTTGALRFALVDGPQTQGRPTVDYPLYAQWAAASCRPVPGYTQPLYVLYDCRR